MRRFRVFFGLFTLFAIALAVQTARAQDDPNFEAGIKPYGTYHGGNIDTIDLSNGSLAIDIPLMSYPQRGGKLKLDFALDYENRGSWLDEVCTFPDSGEVCQWQGFTALDHGFNIIQEHAAAGGYTVSMTHPYTTMYCQCTFSAGIKMSDGPVHELSPISYNNWQSTPLTWESTDGTGYSAIFNLGWMGGSIGLIIGPDGTRYEGGGLIPGPTRPFEGEGGPIGFIPYRPSPVSMEDTNGNQITYSGSGWTDTVGRSIPNPATASPAPPPCQMTTCCPQTPVAPSTAWTWALPGVNGGTYSILFCSITVSETTLADDGLGDGGTINHTYNATQLQSVILPNSTSWTFQYDMTGGTGDLLQVTFPTGGTLVYTWTGSIQLAHTHDYTNIRAVSTRTLNDGINSSETQYFYTGTSPFYTRLNDGTPGGGNESVHTFSGEGYGVYETDAKFYTGTAASGTLLKTVDTSYFTYTADSSNMTWEVLPSQVTTTWPNAQASSVAYTYDTALVVTNDQKVNFWRNYTETYAQGQQNYTISYGRELTKSEYDFTSSLARTTTTNYLALSNSNYLNNNLMDLPSSVQVTDGGGTQRAYTTYCYDGNGSSCDSGVGLQSSGITTQHDASPPAGSYRGNLTSTSRWLNVTSGYLTDYNTFYDTGTVYESVDANGTSATDPNHMTTYAYESTGTFPNQITYPPTGSTTHVENFTYDTTPGLMLTHSDQNSQTTTYTYNDLMERLTNVALPDGGNLGYCYKDKLADSCSPSGTAPYFVFTKKINPTYNFQEVGSVDGVGRIKQTQRTDASCGYVYVNTSYDAVGRKSFVSNPSCSPTVTTGTSYVYDGLSRLCVVIPADGSSVSGGVCPSSAPSNDVFTTYSGGCTTVTDQAGKTRKSCTDGLGRMTGVWEDPGSSPHLNYETDYGYDTLDNLASVSQSSSRSRTFTYDSLSRLVCAANPEIQSVTCPTSATSSFPAGSLQYSYDGNGNLVTRIAPQANQTSPSTTTTTTYCYDNLNRMTQKRYASGSCPFSSPDASYVYDGDSVSACSVGSFSFSGSHSKPLRTAMCDAAGSEAWRYDYVSGTGTSVTGQRITTSSPSNVTKTFTNTYNFDDSLYSIAYPDDTIVYGVNVAEQPTSAVDSTLNINYVPVSGGATYAPHGALASLPNGSSLVSTFFYDTRLQPCRISAKYSGTVPGSCTVSSDTGNIIDLNYNFSLGTADNGNVGGITNNRDNTRSQAFTYDSLNRILTGETTSTHSTSPANCWSEAYVYDQVGGPSAWGNLIHIDGGPSAYNGCMQEGFSLSTATAQNHLTTGTTPDFSYDAAGNVTNNTTNGFYYDPENRICSEGGTSCTSGAMDYNYDGDGKRLSKSSGTLYWYGLSSDPLLETNSSGILTNEYVFFSGKRIARRDSSNNIFYYFADQLGTSRVIVQDGSTPTVCYDADFYPFGGERTPITNTCPQNYKFTGKERDSESGLDNFGARYMSSQYGRFMTPDSAADEILSVPIPFADLSNPQSLNLYSYVRNNPLSFTDPDGQNVNVCLNDENGNQQCHNYTDDQYKKLYNAQNGQQGINLPGGQFPRGSITCGGQTCGSATYNEAPLEDQTAGMVMGYEGGKLAGILLGKVVGAIGGMLGRGAGELAGETAGQSGARVLLSGGSKQAAKDIVEGLADGAQKASAKRAIAAATRSEAVSISESADGSLTITRTRAGFDGSQTFTKTIDSAGSSTTVQTAHDAAGNLVHYDPKN